MAEAVNNPPPPPAGFEIESVPPPPSGFEIEKTAAPSQPPAAPKESIARRLLRVPFESLIPPFAKDSAIARTISDVGASSALPMIGEMAGAASPIPGGAMMGSGAGEAINQLLGVTEPSKTQLGLAVAAPGVGKLAAKPINFASEWIAKKFAGREVMSEAAESLLKKWMSPAVSSEQLYQDARALTQQVTANETLNTLRNVVKAEKGRAPTKISADILEATEPLLQYFQQGKAIPAPELMVEVQRLRALAGEAYKSGNTLFGNSINQIRGALLTDLEKSGAGVVSEAAKAYRKEVALDDLAELMGKAQPLQKIHDFMKNNPLFKGAFSKPEIDQIERIAKKMGTVPVSGGHGIMGTAITGGLGFHEGGLWGMLAGLAGPAAIRKLLESPFGRNYAERLLAGSPTVNPETLAALATFARGLTAKAPPGENSGGDNPVQN